MRQLGRMRPWQDTEYRLPALGLGFPDPGQVLPLKSQAERGNSGQRAFLLPRSRGEAELNRKTVTAGKMADKGTGETTPKRPLPLAQSRIKSSAARFLDTMER